jgi:hypothetical protein
LKWLISVLESEEAVARLNNECGRQADNVIERYSLVVPEEIVSNQAAVGFVPNPL